MIDWYLLDVDEALLRLDSNRSTGLSDGEAKQRLEEYGTNELIERDIKSSWRILWEQVTAVMVLILIAAALVSAALREWDDALVIMMIVVLNAILGFTQEHRAEQAIAALKRMALPTVRVKRNGEIAEISARELVPGDIMLLEVGNRISADGRLIDVMNLQVDEAALTGESESVKKAVITLGAHDMQIGDRINMVHMGTIVTYGRGVALVTNTGMNTQLGGIAGMLQTVEREPTPLQRRLDQLGRVLALVTLVIISVVFFLGLIRGEDWEVMLLTGISLAVAAIPEGLPAVVTITLALGSRRMLKRNALIRKLPAVETLGSVTVICSDKTGTLTENRMTVTVLDIVGETKYVNAMLDRRTAVLDTEAGQKRGQSEDNLSLLLKAATLCNDAILQEAKDGSGELRAIGDPTEGALVVASARFGIKKPELEERWPRIDEVPFTSERKRMTTLHKSKSYSGILNSPWEIAPYIVFSKGAVDSLLEISDRVWVGNNIVPLSGDMLDRINRTNEKLAQQGHRVLGVACRPIDNLPDTPADNELEQQLVFVGLIGLLDPPRPEVKSAVSVSKSAGIRPVMITGDHPLTAQHIANELEISVNGVHLTGSDLTRMPIDVLKQQVQKVAVFARVSPEHKLNIVQALQDNGEVVAMTGDGVNDAPALKKADIGVAMGITGTDVSKDAADMVLLDDNFATIVAAIEEGRVIYDNIRKFIKYILSSNTGEILVMLIAPFLGMPLPLLPLQILWVNLVTDGLPGLALAVEPPERETMARPPYPPEESVLSRGIGKQVLWIGILMGIVSLGVGYRAWLDDANGSWQTMVFTTLTLAQMGNALAIRSGKDSLFTIGLLSNRPMLAAVLLTFVLQMAIIYIPFLQDIFDTQSLSFQELMISLLMSTVVFWAVEFGKWLRRRQLITSPGLPA